MKEVGKKSGPTPIFMGHLSEFDALLGADSGVKRMLDLFHLSDQIGGRNKLGGGVATPDEYMQSRLRSAHTPYFFQHFRQRQHVITEHVNQFIEDEHVVISTA